MMNTPAVPFAAILIVGAGTSFALAASIYQPARRRAEIAALHLTLSVLGVWYLTRSLKSLIAWSEAGFLDQFDAITGTLLLAGGATFLAATHLRLADNRLQYRIERAIIVINAGWAVGAQLLEVLDVLSHEAGLRIFWISYWIFAAIIFPIGAQVLVTLAGARVARREWWAFLALIGGATIALLIFPFFRTGLSGMGADLLPLLTLTAFVYLRFRAIFLDVILRRGVVVLGFFVIGWIYFYFLGGRAGQLPVGGMLFTLFWVTFNGPLSRLVDRLLFGRPDHLRLARRLSIEMLGFVDRAQLLGHVAARLKAALKADFVNWRDKDDDARKAGEAVLIIPVKSSSGVKGELQFGVRRLGQRYDRDDRRFVQSVANQLAAVLENFALRDEQQARIRQEHELREKATRAELHALRLQINPHFFLNTLAIAAAKSIEVPSARAMIINLLDMFRYALDSTKRELVALGEELGFLKSYLEIERERMNGRMVYRIEVEDELRAAQIPPMLLQPLVENAVRHGLKGKREGGCVTISARRSEDRLRLQVADDGVGFDPSSDRGKTAHGRGIGLANVRERIARLGGPDCLRLTSARGAGTMVEIDLKY